MTVVSSIVVFSLIWWLVLFFILPLGVQVDSKTSQKGHADSAPVSARIGRKFLITTLVSFPLFLIVHYLIQINILNIN